MFFCFNLNKAFGKNQLKSFFYRRFDGGGTKFMPLANEGSKFRCFSDTIG